MAYKFGAIVGEEHEEAEYRYPNIYEVEPISGSDRLCIAPAQGQVALLLALAQPLEGPFFLLYVLHTPRGGHQPGRYESQPLAYAQAAEVLRQFQPYLEQDARHDLWLHAAGSDATLVYERHNLIYAYGPLAQLAAALRASALAEGAVSIPAPHAHRYHAAFDADEARLLQALDWHRTPLHPEDEQ